MYVLLFLLVVFCAVLTYMLPAGEFNRVEREVNGSTRMVLVPGSFHAVESNPVGPFKLVMALYSGAIDAADVIFMIFLVYGSFYILLRTCAINGFIGWLLTRLKGKEWLMIAVFFYVFAAGGAFFGLFEEVYGFIPLFVGLGMAMGYDAMVGLAICSLATGIGFAAAMTNPFTIGIAQKIGELPLFSGIGYRFLAFVVFTTVGLLWTLRYANKIKKDPTKSLMYGIDMGSLSIDRETMENTVMTRRDKGILGILLLTIVIMVFGTLQMGWAFEELTALFMIMGVASGFMAGWGPSRICTEFVDGMREIVFGAFIVGVSRAVLIVLREGNIIDTVVFYAAQPLLLLPSWVGAQGMLLVQTCLNFLIPSGSGQAATTMPIMIPLADLIGVSRQTAVMAFHFGDGFSNILWPTADIPVICAIAHVPLEKWWRFFVPLFLFMYVIQMIFLSVAVAINY